MTFFGFVPRSYMRIQYFMLQIQDDLIFAKDWWVSVFSFVHTFMPTDKIVIALNLDCSILHEGI